MPAHSSRVIVHVDGSGGGFVVINLLMMEAQFKTVHDSHIS